MKVKAIYQERFVTFLIFLTDTMAPSIGLNLRVTGHCNQVSRRGC